MAGLKKVLEPERKGKVTYNAGIVNGIVVLAVSEVQGVTLKKLGKKDKSDLIKIDFNGDVVSVDVTVDVLYGHNIPDVAFEIQDSVKRTVESMSRFKVGSVNVHVDSVYFEENEQTNN